LSRQYHELHSVAFLLFDVGLVAPTKKNIKMNNLIIRPKQLAQQIGVSTVTLWRMEKAGELPPRIKLGSRAVGWRTSDITAWLEQLQPSDFKREVQK
jgi:prophage regulatory protein